MRSKQRIGAVVLGAACVMGLPATSAATEIGVERGAPRRLVDGDEYILPTHELIDVGQQMFAASWTVQEGGGRPLRKGTGAPIGDTSRSLVFPFNFNRVSAPDANSCAGCHNLPVVGGGGDIVANSRGTLGMSGSGYIELLARQMTAELQKQRDALAPGQSRRLTASGVEFGWLGRLPDGRYDVSRVAGLPRVCLEGDVPNLVLRPFPYRAD